jgi:hypothetical protein
MALYLRLTCTILASLALVSCSEVYMCFALDLVLYLRASRETCMVLVRIYWSWWTRTVALLFMPHMACGTWREWKGILIGCVIAIVKG